MPRLPRLATNLILRSWRDGSVQFPQRVSSNDPEQGSSQRPISVDPSPSAFASETEDGLDEEAATMPTTIAQKIHVMIPTLPPFSTPIRPKCPVLHSETELPGPPLTSPPGVVNDWKLLRLLSPRAANRSIEPNRQSILSALDLLRSPCGKSLSSPVESTGTVLDCVDDNNSVMVYGPLEPDGTSEVEIACSEIVFVYEDGDEIRTPQARFLPLPTESIKQILMGANESPEGCKGKEKESCNGADSEPFIPPDEPWQSPLSKNGQFPEREYRAWVPSLTKISVQAMWWGFRIYLPPCVLDVLGDRQLEAAKRAAMITTALKWLMDHIPIPLLPPEMRPAVTILRGLVPYLGYVGGFTSRSWSAVKSFDKGHGIVLTATWLFPFALIPSTWEADDFPSLNLRPQSTQTASNSSSRET